MSDRGLIVHLPFNGALSSAKPLSGWAWRGGGGGDSNLGYASGPIGKGRALNSQSTTNTYFVGFSNRPEMQCNAFTIAFWLYETAWVGSYGRIIDKHYTNGWCIHRYNGGNQFCLNIQNNAQLLCGIDVTLNKWEHWAVTRTGTSAKWYHNGQLSNSGSCNGTANTNTNQLCFFTSASDGEYSRGRMADFRYYNRVLNAQEIQWIYNQIARDRSNV
jgi:hypothetical protein